MTDDEIAHSLDRLLIYASNLGYTDEGFLAVVDEVKAEAKTSLTWGKIEDQIAEIRRRLMKRALN